MAAPECCREKGAREDGFRPGTGRLEAAFWRRSSLGTSRGWPQEILARGHSISKGTGARKWERLWVKGGRGRAGNGNVAK